MSLFVACLGRLTSLTGKVTMLIDDMDISRLMVYVQQVKEVQLRDREEFISKKSKTRNEFGQQKSSVNHPSFQKQKRHTPSSATAHAPRNNS